MSDERMRQQNQVFTSGEGGVMQQTEKRAQDVPQAPTTQAHAMRGQSVGPVEHAYVDDLGFEVPVDTVPLPSRGKCYSGTSLEGVTQVSIRAMTAREEDILTSRALLKNGTVITQLLRSCITDARVNPADLITGDRTALIVALRITGYGSDYKVETECPACEHKQLVEFDLSELPVKFLDVEPDVPGANLFSVTLPVSKANVQFRFLTGRDEEEIQREQQAKKKKLKTQLDNLVTSRFMRQIVSVNGRDDKSFISKFVNSMPARDSRFLRKRIADIEPGIEMRSDMICEACGEVSEVDVQIGPTFFWPDD